MSLLMPQPTTVTDPFELLMMYQDSALRSVSMSEPQESRFAVAKIGTQVFFEGEVMNSSSLSPHRCYFPSWFWALVSCAS